MMKFHHKGNFDFNVHSFIFEQISGWAYAAMLREDLWIYSTIDTHVV